MTNEPVNTIMTTDLITISPEDRLDNVRQVFMQNAVHHLPVVNEGKIIGIVTTYDIWKNEIAPQDYATTEVKEIMTTKIAKIGPQDKIGTAAELFLDKRFHALPIVDEEDNLLGIVSSFDVLLYEYKKEYPNPILYKHLFEDDKGQQRMPA